jgi:hypothetical protein
LTEDEDEDDPTGYEIEYRDACAYTFPENELNDKKSWEWTPEHLVRHFSRNAYADPPHLVKYGDQVTALVPQASLKAKPVLHASWIQRCVAAKTLVGEGDDQWGGCLIRFVPSLVGQRFTCRSQTDHAVRGTPLRSGVDC